MEAFFYVGLALNAVSALWLMGAKRSLRESAAQSKKTTEGFVWKHRILDRLTGRDSFYMLIIFVLAAHAFGPAFWPLYSFAAGFLIIGLFVVSAVSFREIGAVSKPGASTPADLQA